MSETWKPIPGFEGYDASDHGRIRSYHKSMGRSGWILTDTPQKLLSTVATKQGEYTGVNLIDESGKRVQMRVHQAIMLAFVGPCPDGLEVCHNSGKKADNRLVNLRYDTHKANVAEACLQGSRTLSPKQVLAIRTERANGKSCVELAKEYGMSQNTISQICWRKIYRAVGGPLPSKKNYRKLSPSDTITIRQRRIEGASLCQLAIEYGVDESTISRTREGAR